MTEPQPLDLAPIHARHESFLRQTIVHSVGMIRTPAGTMGAHADASVNAWWAHRLLAALAESAPDQVLAIVADISNELEMGDAHQSAYEDALAIGIDVDALIAHAEDKFAGNRTT